MSERPKIIYNTAGALCCTLREKDVATLGEILNSAGFDGVSVLPNRAINQRTINYLPHQTLLVEDSWNSPKSSNFFAAAAEGFVGQIRYSILKNQGGAPLLHDGIFFLNQKDSQSMVKNTMRQFPQAKYVSVHPGFVDNIEAEFPRRTLLHPQSLLPHQPVSIPELLEAAQKHDTKFLYDPTHLVEAPNGSGINWQAARAEISQFRGFVAGIDLPYSYDVRQNLSCPHSEISRFVRCALNQPGGLEFIRIEGILPLSQQLPLLRDKHRSQLTDTLRRTVDTVNSIISHHQKICGC